MKIQRVWAMPSKDTFDCIPIKEFVQIYLEQSRISVDPFARDQCLFTFDNDLNPETEARSHLDALDFLAFLDGKEVQANLGILDPPYSLTQIKKSYKGFGRILSPRECQRFYGDVRDAMDRLIVRNGVVLSFGWNSIGMGKKRGYEIEEVLLVCHGRAHNDTICVADRKKRGGQPALWDAFVNQPGLKG